MSRKTNAMLARIVFGLSALIVLGMLLMALRDLFSAFSNRKNNRAK